MNRDIDWNKVGRYLAGEASQEEREEFERSMANDAELEVLVAEVRHIWEKAAGGNIQKWDLDHAWGELRSKTGLVESHSARRFALPPFVTIHGRRFSASYRLAMSLAAILLVSLGISYLVFQSGKAQDEHEAILPMKEIVAARGHRVTFKFEEGSEVVLNAGSTLRYPAQFSSDRREVFLEGEALFRASRVNDIPFIVKAGSAAVEVLGTQFNVRAWPGELSMQIIVAEGRVAIRPEGEKGNASVILRSGQMSLISDKGEVSLPSMVDVTKELSWTSGELLFDKTPLRAALGSLERTYGLVCKVSDTSILSRRLTAKFRDESTDEVLKMMSLSLDLRYKRTRDTVLFRDNTRYRRLQLDLPVESERR